MKKTTLYIEDGLLRRIKEEAIRRPGMNMTRIINAALASFLEPGKEKAGKFENLRKAIGISPVFREGASPADVQKKLREEWD